MRFRSALATGIISPNSRLARLDLFRRRWLDMWRVRRNLPVPVKLNRLAAPLCVFIFGIDVSFPNKRPTAVAVDCPDASRGMARTEKPLALHDEPVARIKALADYTTRTLPQQGRQNGTEPALSLLAVALRNGHQSAEV
jgi:hypothetical protein